MGFGSTARGRPLASSAAEPHFVLPTGTDDQAAPKALWCQVEEIEGRLDCLREEFLSTVNGSNLASWRAKIGNPTRELALNARAADLILTGSPSTDLVVDHNRMLDAASLILASRGDDVADVSSFWHGTE